MKKRLETLGLILLFILSVFVSFGYSVSADYTFDDNTVFQIGNENYTFPSGGITFSTVVQNESWIRFNNTDFNITSTNNIDITLSYLYDNLSHYSNFDSLLIFRANTNSSTVWFNISGFTPDTNYTLYIDNIHYGELISNSTGSLNFQYNDFSSHEFNIKKKKSSSGDILSLDTELLILIIWAFIVFMLYKTNRDYMGVASLLGLTQIALIVSVLLLGYFDGLMQYMLIASVCFLFLGIYKDYYGYTRGY